MPRWGMVIDLKLCVGCWGCSISCKQDHFLPRGILWNRVLISERGKFPATQKIMYPILCNHCEEAPCIEVCPTGASQRREDGIVWVDYDACTGCRACVVACPYQQRTFYEGEGEEYFPEQGLTSFEIMGRQIYPLQKGTVVKCNFCAERITEGLKKGAKPGIDREATPTCVNTCPAKARHFGDLDDPRSNVSQMIKRRKGTPFHSEFGTKPSVYYVD